MSKQICNILQIKVIIKYSTSCVTNFGEVKRFHMTKKVTIKRPIQPKRLHLNVSAKNVNIIVD